MGVVCSTLQDLSTNHFSESYMVFRCFKKSFGSEIKSTATENTKFLHILITLDNYSLPLVALLTMYDQLQKCYIFC